MAPKKRTATDVDAAEKKIHPMFAKKQKTGATSAPVAGVMNLWSLLDDNSGWKTVLAAEAKKEYFVKLSAFLAAEEKAGKEVFPPQKDIFTAFNTTHFKDVKTVIIGQDPYHDNNQAHGLCFSVLPGIKPPPSLKNMYIELEKDIPTFKAPSHGYLLSWAQQGVLMINATLTVEAHKANSHQKSGWQTFTDAAIVELAKRKEPVVFLLWGGFAQKKSKLINKHSSGGHVIIECAHPSPLSVTKWRGCKTFSKANAALKKLGKDPIDWTLPEKATVA